MKIVQTDFEYKYLLIYFSDGSLGSRFHLKSYLNNPVHTLDYNRIKS